MEFIYPIINFLILAALIFLFGRKMIVSIFAKRRSRVNSELDAAEKAEAAEASGEREGDETSDDTSDDTLSGQTPVVSAEELAAERCREIRQTCEESLRVIHKEGEDARVEQRREMISDLHNRLSDMISHQMAGMLSSEPYVSRLRSHEPDMVDTILSEVRLTPGDMAYLRTHDVLYVTLISVFPLDEALVDKVRQATDRLLESVGGKTSFWVRRDPSLIGGLCLRIGDTIYDCSAAERLHQLEYRMERDLISGEEDMDHLLNELQEDMDKLSEEKLFIYQLGRVLSVSDGICWMDGLADMMYGEVVEFACGERGMVLDIQQDRIGCVIYGNYAHIESGSRVRRVGRIASVPVGDVLLGRVVDAIGHAVDGKGQIRTSERRPIECHAPAILDRAPVSQPMHTGIKAIDALVPVGRGQRELIIGDRQTGKTSLAIDTIIHQKGKGIVCIYVAIGQKDTSVADVKAKLEKHGAMDYTVIVSAPASASASLQYIAPFSGTAMGEYFMYAGRDVLIIYDDLSKHAVAYRELSLLLHRPSGREAYPGDIFYLHSRLLERSAKLAPSLGGGSMTALPIIETQAGDISSYIPTNVISITDGQIFLDTELFYEGQRPAVNVGLSVSRVGSAAQTKLMKQVSASLRMKLAQYRELSGFSQFGTEVDERTAAILRSGQHMMAALKQGRLAPLDDWKQALLIYTVAEGYADQVPVDRMDEFEQKLFNFAMVRYPQLQAELATGCKMTDECKQKLNEALKVFSGECVWQESNN